MNYGRRASDAVLPIQQKWVWDKKHIGTVLAFSYGLIQTGEPLIESAIAKHSLTPMSIVGLVFLVGSAVVAFFDDPPSSVEAAIDAGKATVGQAAGILAKRASLHPPVEFPKATPTLIVDPEKTVEPTGEDKK